MTTNTRWIAAAATVAVLALHGLWFTLARRRNPQRLGRSVADEATTRLTRAREALVRGG